MKAKLLAAGEGINIYLKYSDMPKNSDESILFVHGYPDSHSSWEKQLDFFKTEFQVGAFDLRGAGKSTAPFDRSGYRISELVNDLKSVIDDMVGKDGKIHLVGHDWGSIIC
ncbi:MAG TPA: alpha/beta fold hydrolase, partial [Leptospiraceae bacterium]|nr:alpha/beta fold hydrolase [Leptospiraceae bacterium]